MSIETCTVSLPPPPPPHHLGDDVGDFWPADRVPCCLRWQPGHGHVDLWRQEEEEDEREEAQPGASREVQGAPKLVAKPPVAGPSGNRSPAAPTRTTRTGSRQMNPTYTSTPRSSKSGSTLPPTAPVELPVTMEVPVEQVAQKRKASSPLPPKTVTRPVSPPSPRRWETARSRIRGRFREYISPPVDNIADLPRKPASDTWQVLPEEMGKVNIGLAGRNAMLVISTCQVELFQQVIIDKAVVNATGHALLRSLLGDGYRIMLPCIIKLYDKYPWLQISDSSQ